MRSDFNAYKEERGRKEKRIHRRGRSEGAEIRQRKH
jgi:hypothetical protein